MDIVLHVGAHRTGSTTFQNYMRQVSCALSEQKTGFWGPYRLRRKLLQGVTAGPHVLDPVKSFERARSKIAMNIKLSRKQGLARIVVSEENMLGSMRGNVSGASLYPEAGLRLSQHLSAFGGDVTSVHLSIRALDTYWVSLISFCIPRGMRVPPRAKLDRLAAQARNWRDVICDLAAAAPGVPITVSTFEGMASRPEYLAQHMLGVRAPEPPNQIWRNARPRGTELLSLPLDTTEITRLATHIHGTRWQPFSSQTRAMLQERYADDLFWLQSGADGLATLIQPPREDFISRIKAETHLPSSEPSRGHRHDNQGQLEAARRERAARTGSG